MQVGPGVLIPRPESENLIDFCEDALRSHPDLGRGYWVDLGTGSGVPGCSCNIYIGCSCPFMLFTSEASGSMPRAPHRMQLVNALQLASPLKHRQCRVTPWQCWPFHLDGLAPGAPTCSCWVSCVQLHVANSNTERFSSSTSVTVYHHTKSLGLSNARNAQRYECRCFGMWSCTFAPGPWSGGCRSSSSAGGCG